MTAKNLFETARMPVLVPTGDTASALPLQHTQVSAQIVGLHASVNVSQRFQNPLYEPAELDYLFPLPEDSAVTGFEIRVGDRRIMGDLQEREAARAAYDAALEQGERAGLFEQRRLNLFALRIANVQVNEIIQAVVSYQQRVKFDDGTFQFVFPMGLTPKYDRPQHPEEGQGVHAPIAGAEERIGPVEIEIFIDPGLAVQNLTSPSHKIRVEQTNEQSIRIELAGDAIPDHDFVLRYELASDRVEAAGWRSGEKGEEFFLATLTPPRMEGEPSVLPREFVFVLDRSGSMTGEPIAQARNALRACLRSLNLQDYFRILLFDNDLEWFQNETLPVTQANVDAADAYLARVEGRGGTEIIRALDAALGLSVNHQRARYVVFLTDGAVSAEAQALVQIRARIGKARLFTFGIGPSVNRALLSQMARLGRGKAEFLQLNEDIEGAIIRFQDRVTFPALTNVNLRWENAKAWDVYPARLPDLYYGEPLEICGRISRLESGPISLIISAERDGQLLELSVLLPLSEEREIAMERIWARARVDDLAEQRAMKVTAAQDYKAETLALAFEYNLISEFTSFVAVDQDATASQGQKPRIIHIAQPLPQGLSPEGFIGGGGAIPQAKGVMMAALRAPAPSAMGSFGKAFQQVMPERRVQERTGESALLSLDKTSGREKNLRRLARTQLLDGSWNGDVEFTAAAVTAFIRCGYTTTTGSFRQVVRRAAAWLADHSGSGFAAFARALAFVELAGATGNQQDVDRAAVVRAALPAPATILEQAVLGEPVAPLTEIRSLDDLRLAAVMKINLPVPPEIAGAEADGIAAAWKAALGS